MYSSRHFLVSEKPIRVLIFGVEMVAWRDFLKHKTISKGVNMGVSENRGTPKSSILIGFSIINHSFWGIPIFGNTHMENHPKTPSFTKKR